MLHGDGNLGSPCPPFLAVLAKELKSAFDWLCFCTGNLSAGLTMHSNDDVNFFWALCLHLFVCNVCRTKTTWTWE
jgi:hypothetical protein